MSRGLEVIFINSRKAVEQAAETQERSTPELKSDFYSIDELSPLSTPACSPPASPTTSRSPSPPPSVTAPPRPQSPAVSHSPIRPDSPLLCPHTLSPALRRARSFNKDLRRAASFRAARERQSLSRNNSPACSRWVEIYLLIFTFCASIVFFLPEMPVQKDEKSKRSPSISRRPWA